MRNLPWLLCLSLMIPNVSFALLCPQNFNVIEMGDSIDLVREKCGKPSVETKNDVEREVPQEWTYFLQHTVSTNTNYHTQGTLKVTVAFDKNDKAININVNGIAVGESTICGKPIKLDNSREQVKAACGNPTMKTRTVSDEMMATGATQGDTDTITVFQYASTPPVSLVFKNGVLTGTQ